MVSQISNTVYLFALHMWEHKYLKGSQHQISLQKVPMYYNVLNYRWCRYLPSLLIQSHHKNKKLIKFKMYSNRIINKFFHFVKKI